MWALLTLCAVGPLLAADPGEGPLDTSVRAAELPCELWPARLRRVLELPLAANRASAVDLENVPGIGPRRASAIVAERDASGPFGGGAELARRVHGIGPRTAARLEAYLFYSGPDPACAPKRS